MSVLLKGMEMPENCAECGVEWCERWKGLIIAGMSIAKSRPTNCPFVEVPTPHGRLIDADAILEEAKRISGPITGDGWDNYGVYSLIERQPTVIEAEEANND